MNEQLKLCLRAYAEPAYKEACDRTIKFLDITRFAQKECTSPLHVLGLPFNDTLFRVTIGTDHALTMYPKPKPYTPNPEPVRQYSLSSHEKALAQAQMHVHVDEREEGVHKDRRAHASLRVAGVMISAAGSVLSRALGFNVGILNTIWRF